MNSQVIIVQIVFFIIINVQFDGRSNQVTSLFGGIKVVDLFIEDRYEYAYVVEAAPKHPKQMGSWFGSLEQVDFRDMQVTPTTTDIMEVKPPTHKKIRKRKTIKKKKGKVIETDKQELKKKKKHKKKDRRRFVKTMVRERDGEYNASSSIENGDGRKPVDIIVHIKMND